VWHNLNGTLAQAAGTSGTVTLRAGSIVLLVIAHASAGSATVSILGGAAIPIVNGAAPIVIQNWHTLLKVDASNTGTIVFTNTDSYYVQCLVEGNV
jgi:hypothetical protein